MNISYELTYASKRARNVVYVHIVVVVVAAAAI